MKIIVFGGGAFGTSIANQLSYNADNEITILLRDQDVIAEVNELQTNKKYFPNRRFHNTIKASSDYAVVKDADLVFIALPSKAISEVAANLKTYLNPETLVINLAKGIYSDGQTIVEFLKECLGHRNVLSFKGASFSVEVMDKNATLYTLGFDLKAQYDRVSHALKDTNIFLDSSTDIRGVELLSALKNIYAIVLGNIDAKFNSANTRFLFLTKAISEIKIILKALGGREETIFLSCGLGDLSLTALNDLSRNRTLGLLIGKGFYNKESLNNSVVLEGIKTVKLLTTCLSDSIMNKLPILKEVIKLFQSDDKKSLDFDFEKLFRKNLKTVLTYGSFDLLHFGHLEILRRAKELGDQLIIGLSTDEFNLVKGKICVVPYEKRKQLLESIQYVDLIIPENNWEQKIEDVLRYNVDYFVMGDDWEGKFDFLNKYCEVVYLPRTKGISTTKLKQVIKEEVR
jgi:glycerol-3-phosphate cytidylyltransferase